MNYVDNKSFLESMEKYYEEKKRLGDKCTIPEEIGEQILKIAIGVSRMNKFNSYSFKDEMISDGVVNCIEYIDNFNPQISKNPFAYFTQIIYYAFIRKIELEKKLLYKKYKRAQQLGISIQDVDDNPQKYNLYDNQNDFIANFEEKQKIKKSKLKKTKINRGVELFL